MEAIIEIKDYTWKYRNTDDPALDNLNLRVEAGSFTGVVGPNGSGKTTLAYSIDGLVPGQYHGVKHGSVEIRGREVEQYEPGELQRIVGVVFSDPEAQFTAMTVEDELVFGMENLGLSLSEIQERLDWVVELVDLGPLLEKPPYEISGGQKQRVALAAVLAMMPAILILDEPTSMLDPLSTRRVFDVLYELSTDPERTVIVIEHDLNHLVKLADRMILLNDGKLLLHREKQEFFQHVDLLLEHQVYPPQAAHFFYELKQQGQPIGNLPLDLEAAVASLHGLFQARAGARGRKTAGKDEEGG